MVAIKTVDIRNDFKRISDIVMGGEKVLVSRPRNENLVIISESDYNELEKAKRNAEYYKKLDVSLQQVSRGKVVVKSMEELEDMSK